MLEDVAVPVRSPVPEMSVGYLGDLVAWTFGDAMSGSEFSTKRELVRQAFDAAGYSWQKCLPDPDPDTTLVNAQRSGGIRVGPDILVKQIAKADKTASTVLCVYKREKRDGEVGDFWNPGARVRFQGDQVVATSMPDGTELDLCIAVAKQIAERTNHLLENVCNQELSHAIVAAGNASHWALFRRNTGGAYWISSAHSMRFRRLLDSLEKMGGFWPIIQPLFADGDGRTQRNVGEAASAAIAQELEQITKELDDPDKEVTPKIAENRKVKCRELMVKALLYREALSDRLEATKQAIAEAEKRFDDVMNLDEDEQVFASVLKEVSNA